MGFIKDIIVNVKRFVNKKTLKDANLDPHNVRNYLTDRDSAFIYALGIQPTKDKTLIKKAYRKMVIIYHPDKAGDNKMIRKINEAYETLMRL